MQPSYLSSKKLSQYHTYNLLQDTELNKHASQLHDEKFCLFELAPSVYCITLYLCHVSAGPAGKSIYSKQDRKSRCEKLLQCVPPRSHVLVCINLEEANEYDTTISWYLEFNHQLRVLKDSESIKNYTIITNSSFNKFLGNSIYRFDEPLENFIAIHWFLLTYSKIYESPIDINYDANKVLYLPGKLDKVQRIGPLYDILTTKKYKEKCVYAYTADQHNWNGSNTENAKYSYVNSLLCNIKDYCGVELLPTQLMDFLRDNECDVDGLQARNVENSRALMQPIPEETYKEISVEIVTETSFPGGVEHITEKTFRPMLAGRPFVHTCSMTTRYLEMLGFKVFRYMTGDGWTSHGYYNLDPDIYGTDREIHLLDLRNNIKAAFDLAEHCTHEYSHLTVQHNIQYNQQKCRDIVNGYTETLNRRHDGLFDEDAILKLCAIFGFY